MAEYLIGIGSCLGASAALIAAVASLRGNKVARSVKEDTAATRHVSNAALAGIAPLTSTTPATLLEATKVPE